VADGLPAEEIRAVAVTRGGIVLAAAGTEVGRLESERWLKQTGPAEVTALFAPAKGPNALAGATNGVWALNSGQWQIETGSPASVIAFAAEPDGTPWALAPNGVWRRGDTWKLIHDVDDDQMKKPRSLLPNGPGDAFVASATGLYGLMGKRKYWLDLEVRPGELLSTDTRALARLDEHHFLLATDKGLNLSDGQRGWHSFTGADGLPILDLTGVAVAGDGTVWLGSNDGLVRWKDGRWTYLASKRWLPDNHITAIAPATDGAVWVGTPKGLAHIHHRKMTLADKAAIYQKDLESRDRRHGYVTIMHLQSPGMLEGAMQEISDNDGLWTALYIASQSFRHAVTKSPEARAQASRSMKALLRLESITGISGFPARAICNVNEPQFGRRSLRSDSEWHESPIERDWYWKGETSSDELDGHYLGWHLFYDLAASEAEKAEVRAPASA
jgi:ligand-binding sensor domain-containing protein